MNLYRVYNGYMANGPVFVIVLAETEEKAKESAAAKFKEHRPNMPETFWTNLFVEFLSDANDAYVSSVEEG